MTLTYLISTAPATRKLRTVHNENTVVVALAGWLELGAGRRATVDQRRQLVELVGAARQKARAAFPVSARAPLQRRPLGPNGCRHPSFCGSP